MGLDLLLRPYKEVILAPIARVLARFVSALAVTVAALLAGIACAAAAYVQRYDLALLFWLFNRVLDGIDGTVARVSDTQSNLGGYLDLVFDIVVYASVPTALAIGRMPQDTSAVAACAVMQAVFFLNIATLLLLSALLEKMAAGAAASGEMTSITMPSGLIEGTETVVFFSLFLAWPDRATQLFSLFSALVVVTSIQRILWAWRHLPHPQSIATRSGKKQ